MDEKLTKKWLEGIDERQSNVMKELTDNITALKNLGQHFLDKSDKPAGEENDGWDECFLGNPSLGYSHTLKLICQDLDRLEETLDYINIDIGRIVRGEEPVERGISE